MIRKNTHDCHSGYLVEYVGEEKIEYIFVDDMISTGETIKRVWEKMDEEGHTYKGAYTHTDADGAKAGFHGPNKTLGWGFRGFKYGDEEKKAND